MSTHSGPGEDNYRELDRKVGEAELELVANLAETDKALDTAVKKGKEHATEQAEAARAQLKQKAAARSIKNEPDGL